MSWQREVDELRRLEAMAREMGGPEKLARHTAAGKLTVRERIGRLVDTDSFHEIGAISGFADYALDGSLVRLSPTNFLFGRGRIDGGRWSWRVTISPCAAGRRTPASG
jgi:acetyl-CoA carboxylase carboxyltransferase component